MVLKKTKKRFYSGPVTTLLVTLVPPSAKARAYSAAIILCHLFGDALSPPLIGLLSDRLGSLRPAAMLIPASLVVATLFWFAGLLIERCVASRRNSFVEPI